MIGSLLCSSGLLIFMIPCKVGFYERAHGFRGDRLAGGIRTFFFLRFALVHSRVWSTKYINSCEQTPKIMSYGGNGFLLGKHV